MAQTYIHFNTRQRSLAGDNFLKDFFILMNNSVFGKTQENLRNRVNVEPVTDAHLLRKRVVRPTFFRGNPVTDCHIEQSSDSYVESSYLYRVYSA